MLREGLLPRSCLAWTAANKARIGRDDLTIVVLSICTIRVCGGSDFFMRCGRCPRTGIFGKAAVETIFLSTVR